MSKIKIFICGALSGSLILVGANILLKSNKNSNKSFDKPLYEESFSNIKEVEEYTFDYYGKPVTIQGSEVKIYSFDKNNKMTIKDGEKKEVENDNSYLLDEYISDNEAIVYKTLENKDNVKNPFSIYVLFSNMEDVYKEYLNRKPFNTLEDRKEAIYKVCYDYMLSDGYTIGGYTYNELPNQIKNDIQDCVNDIYYMRQNNKEKEKSNISEFINKQSNVIKYELFKIGR